MIPIFNFLRGIACFLVVMTHTVTHQLNYFLNMDVYTFRCFRNIFGLCGMSFFFFTTGFLISLSLDKLDEQNGTGVASYKFLIRRAFRLLPVLTFCVMVCIFVNCFTGVDYYKKLYQTPYLILVNALKTLFAVDFIDVNHFKFPMIDVAWSLAVEYKFYFIAALAWLCFKDARSRLYGMLAFLGILFALVANTKHEYFYLYSNVSLIYVCLVGALTYFYYFNKISQKEFLIVLISLLAVIYHAQGSYLCGNKIYVCGTLMTTICVLKFSNFGKHKIFKFFADISYSMYLLHALVFIWIKKYSFLTPTFTKMSSPEKILVEFGIYFMLLPICYLIYRFIEKPFIKIGYKLTGGGKDGGKIKQLDNKTRNF